MDKNKELSSGMQGELRFLATIDKATARMLQALEDEDYILYISMDCSTIGNDGAIGIEITVGNPWAGVEKD